MIRGSSTWPVDGRIVFAALCAALITIVAGAIGMARNVVVRREQGRFHLRPSRSGTLLHLGFVAGTLSGLYAAARAKDTPTNPHNSVAALLVSIAIVAITLYLLDHYFTACSFDEESLRIRRPGRAERTHWWPELAEIGVAHARPYLRFRNSRRIYRPFGRTGQEQFTRCIQLLTLPLAGEPLCAVRDAGLLAELPGRWILCRVVAVDDDYVATPDPPFVGRITSADRTGIAIEALGPARRTLIVGDNLRPLVALHPRGATELLARLHLAAPEMPSLMGLWFERRERSGS